MVITALTLFSLTVFVLLIFAIYHFWKMMKACDGTLFDKKK